MMDSGFYKNDGGLLLFAPNFVAAPGYMLDITLKDSYEFPVDDWYWFDSRDAANVFFGLPTQSGTGIAQ